MKKRFLTLFFALLLSMVLVGCNDTVTTTTTAGQTTTTTLERLATPTGLTVTGQVLSWTAVPNAASYAVYVNDVLQTTVTTTQYDFSALTGAQLLFRVVAKAPSGGTYADSSMSSSAAYVANATAEIEAINALLVDFIPGAPEGFADELVRKGMTAEEFGEFKTSMTALMDTMETEPDAATGNVAIGELLETDVNYEALFGGLILMQQEMLEAGIDELQTGKTECQDSIDLNGNDWSCEYPISYYDSQLAMQETMLEMMTEEADQLALIAANTLDYIALLQSQISGTLLADIDGLMNSEDAPTPAELLAIKNEVVALLLENMPPSEDLELLAELFGGMISAMEGGLELGTEIASLAGPLSTLSTASLELYLTFFESLDLAFFTELQALSEASTSEVAMQLELQILFLEAFHAFENANAALFDAVENALTEAEQEALFEAYIISYPNLMAGLIDDEEFDPAVFEDLFASLTWSIVSGLSDVEAKINEIVLDHYIATDFAALRAMAFSDSFEYDYWEDQYINRMSGIVYETYTAYAYAEKIAMTDVFEANFALAQAVLDGTTQADFEQVLEFVLAVVPMDLFLQSFEYAGTYDADAFLTALRALVEDQNDEVRTFIAEFVDYVVDETVFADLQAEFAVVHNHQLTAIGEDYMDGYYDDTLDQYAMAIFAANHITAFMTSTREASLKSIADAVFDLLDTAPYRDLLGFTTEQVASLRTDFTTMVDDFLAQADLIKNYDYLTLSPTEIENLDAFVALLDDVNEKTPY